MKKNWKKIMLICTAGAITTTQISACGNQSAKTTVESASQAEAETTTEMRSEIVSDQKEISHQVTVQLGENGEKTIAYWEEDGKATWDEATAVRIKCDDNGITAEGEGAQVTGQTVKITNAGTYVVSGTLTNGQILIETDEDMVVQLVLAGVELSNQSTAPIYHTGKGKMILTLASDSSNTISDSSEYSFSSAEEDEPNAPIFSKGDLTINGNGTLAVCGNYECAIRSKGVLTVVSGDLKLQAETDGLKGKDAVIIRDGNINIQSGKDGIKSNNDQEAEKGYIWIEGGQITIAAKDDGIQAEHQLMINGGTIEITESQEALAGKTVDIMGGQIRAMASDDGINSAAAAMTEREKMQDQDGVYTRIAGGEIWLNAAADGIDSNGDLYLEGGSVYLSGPTGGGNGILDYNGKGYLTGGTLFAVGTADMMQTFESTSTQNYLVIYYTETQKAGTVISLNDGNGNEIGRYMSEKDFNAAIISTAEIEQGNSYQVVTGEETVMIQAEDLMSVSGTPTGGMGSMRGPGTGPDGMERPEEPGGDIAGKGDSKERGRRMTEDGELPPFGEWPESITK